MHLGSNHCNICFWNFTVGERVYFRGFCTNFITEIHRLLDLLCYKTILTTKKLLEAAWNIHSNLKILLIDIGREPLLLLLEVYFWLVCGFFYKLNQLLDQGREFTYYLLNKKVQTGTAVVRNFFWIASDFHDI